MDLDNKAHNENAECGIRPLCEDDQTILTIGTLTPSSGSRVSVGDDVDNETNFSNDSDMDIINLSYCSSTCPLVQQSPNNTDYRSTRSTRNGGGRALLNVGGEKHEIMWDALAKFPSTRLGKLRECRNNYKSLLEICDDYNLKKKEFFFDRHPKAFGAILNLYRNKRIHFHGDFCVVDFNQDLIYWGIDECYLDSCCRHKFQQKRENLLQKLRKQPSVENPTELFKHYNDDDFGTGKLAELRKLIWDLFERPFYRPAQIMSMLSVSFILLSILTFCLSTVRAFQDFECTHPNKTVCSSMDLEAIGLLEVNSPINQSKLNEYHIIVKDSWKLRIAECTCIIWFTVEYLLRLVACPDKWIFLKNPLNIIDLLAILPYYCSQILMFFNTSYSFLQVLLIIRVLRILKLSRHSTGLQSLGYTFQRSRQDLGVLLLILFVFIVIFSSLAYFAERHSNPNFTSIPACFWWALVTMTTVGYGDVVPITILGKVIGMITAVCGVVVVAMPIALTMNSFGAFYEQQRQKERMLRLHKHFFKKDRESKTSTPA